MSLAAEADFGLSLLREISTNSTTVLSPLSIALALSLVHIGARGSSRDQIKNAICKDSSNEDCASYFSFAQRTLMQKNSFDDGVRVNIANRIFVGDNFNINQAYLDEVSTKFNSTAQSINFRNPSLAAEIVNDFVKKETMGMIEKLVTEETFQDGGHETKALIVNTIYFKGAWQEEFSYTKSGNFFLNEDDANEVNFMKQHIERFPYAQNDDFMALSLPYKDQKTYAFTVLLPKERYGLSSALSTLTGEKLQKLISPQEEAYFHVTIPEFKLDAEISLPDVLKKLGIIDPFIKQKADFSGMSRDRVFVGDALQKATIEVNKEGSSAAAATYIKMVNCSGGFFSEPPVAINFVADHPFLFLIRQAGHILFTGLYHG